MMTCKIEEILKIECEDGQGYRFDNNKRYGQYISSPRKELVDEVMRDDDFFMGNFLSSTSKTWNNFIGQPKHTITDLEFLKQKFYNKWVIITFNINRVHNDPKSKYLIHKIDCLE